MGCCGDIPTLETLAAVDLLRGYFPDLKVRVVNVVDLMRLQPEKEHPHGFSDNEFDMIFTTDKPIMFAFHGYPWLIHRLTYRRRNHRNLHVRGYKEEGTTTTPFDMVVRNEMDRFHLVGGRHRPDPEARRPSRLREAGDPRPADRAQRVHRSTATTCKRSRTGPGGAARTWRRKTPPRVPAPTSRRCGVSTALRAETRGAEAPALLDYRRLFPSVRVAALRRGAPVRLRVSAATPQESARRRLLDGCLSVLWHREPSWCEVLLTVRVCFA